MDHREFIEKYHRTPVPDKQDDVKIDRFAVAVTIGLVGLYLGVLVIFSVWLELQPAAVIAAGLSFVAAAGFSVFIQRIFDIRSSREREKDIMRQVLEGSRGARMITDAAGNVIYANTRMRELCKDDGDVGLDSLSRLFQGQSDTEVHFRLLAEQAHRGLRDSIELPAEQNERECWYQIMAQPVANYAGFIHWRVDDITAQRQADRSIREEREKLIDFTDNAPVGFFSVDQDGRFMFVNATLARWLGEDIQTILKQGHLHTYIIDPPEDAPYNIVPEGGAKQLAEVTMKGPAGRTFTASISQAVVDEGDGQVRTRGVVHDLTSERAMRQALKASEDRFERFFSEAPVGIALLNSEAVMDDCNAALASMLGFQVSDLEGEPFVSLLAEGDRQSGLSAFERIEKGKRLKAPVELELIGKNRKVSVQMYARRLEGSDSIVVHFIDLTEQKELEEQFVQSQKMQAIGQLAGGVAHDFNNLLTAMIGFCDLLLLRHKPGDPSFSDIMQIKQNANRAANLVRQLLAFSRQQTLRPKVQDISDILTEVSHLLRRLIGANIELEVVHGSDLGLVKVDVGQMEQVLINLAVNARDAMPEGGKLTVKTSSFENSDPLERGGDDMPPGRWVCMAVSDVGTGISSENLSRIFEPFFTTKEVGQGTGLGLATVYGIIRQTGGYLHVDSEIGKGTSFQIYLPCISEEDAQQETEEDEESPEDTTRDLTGTACIMLVEDEDAVRSFSTRALTNKGYQVLEAEGGESALRIIEERQDITLDLLVTDVIMPDMDGTVLAKKVREINPDMKIIFMSGYTEEKLKEHMDDRIWFLPKPFTLKQLAAKVKEVMDE